jgi:hypothetical protein
LYTSHSVVYELMARPYFYIFHLLFGGAFEFSAFLLQQILSNMQEQKILSFSSRTFISINPKACLYS